MDAHLWQVWCWCMMKANHKGKFVNVRTGRGNMVVTVEPGQFIFGRKKAAMELDCPAKSVYNRMLKLVKCQNVAMQVDTHFSIVSICNWESYQSEDEAVGQATGHPLANHWPTNGQPMDTNNNVKNEKNDKNEGDAPTKKKQIRNIIPPTVLMVSDYCIERSNGIDAQYFHDTYTARNWFISKNKMKDWQAAVRTWERNGFNTNEPESSGFQASV